jgi:tetratricopeptide (TPR) repeat protein
MRNLGGSSLEKTVEIEETEEDKYASNQASLQRRADDLHKGGQLEDAIALWVECLQLAEEHQDTLSTNKTELLCILVGLHLQVSSQQHEQQYIMDDFDADGVANKRRSPEEVDRGSRFHQQAAKRYVHRIKPALVKPHWLVCSKPLLDFFCQAEAWELAILVAEQLLQEPGVPSQVDPQQLARIHFQAASQNLGHRQGEALEHLQATVKNLQQVPVESRDMTMYLQVLQLLATEYYAQGRHTLTLEAYQEQLNHSPVEKRASLYCQMAQIYISTQQLDLALEQLEAAASQLDSSEQSIRLQLLQTKGDVYCRLGRMAESLVVYELALKEAKNPAETAKLLYTLGRLCARLKRIRPAISYFTREMEITKAELGLHHMSVSRVLHELATLYDEGLGEHKMALKKLHKALQIESAVLQECHYAIGLCPKCNPVAHRMCGMHSTLQRDVSHQIRETKKSQGRLYFKLGQFDMALQTSLS